MKKIYSSFLIGVILISVTSCNKFLDINDNPNDPLGSTPQLILPQAITTTANNMRRFVDYGGQLMGYYANGGGVSGWGSIITYNFTTGDFRLMWDDTYNNLMDYEYVINQSADVVEDTYFNAIAKIMKAYNFQLLVDAYNDVPYSQAFQGNTQLSVPYDNGIDVYKSITDLVDQAISAILEADHDVVAEVATQQDPLFKGDMDKWLQFAQTLKLKLMLRANGKVQFSNQDFDEGIGFLTDDAIANPGYAKVEGKQNRMWDGWVYSAANSARGFGSQFAPTPYILGFYDGKKLDDPTRGDLVYRTWPSVSTNQLGYQGSDAGRGTNPTVWMQGTSATSYSEIGVFKGPDAGQVLMLAAEAYFMLAEANVTGLVPGDAKANFENGLEASYRYLYKDIAGTLAEEADPAADVADYIAANAGSYLVNFTLADTDEKKTEAIITQKYVAQNMILSHESWNDFRRTGYPATLSAPAGNAVTSFVSLTSEASTPNRLPNRILYPQSEFNYNGGNAKTIDPNTDKIFWAK